MKPRRPLRLSRKEADELLRRSREGMSWQAILAITAVVLFTVVVSPILWAMFFHFVIDPLTGLLLKLGI